MSAISVNTFVNAKVNEENIIRDIVRIYQEDERPIAIGYSGGKDSSVVVDLVVRALLRIHSPQKPVYVMFSDTLMEMDPVIEDINRSLERLESFAKIHTLPIEILRVKPEIKETMWSLIIGAGYRLMTRDFRFCTDRLKVRPQERAISHLIEKYGGFISVMGQRRAESADRAKRMQQHTIEGSLLKLHDNKSCSLYTPIEFYSSDDVWDYLYTRATEWIDATALGKVYADAAGDGGECRTLLEGIEGEQAGCSKSARYGCWVCTLFEKDKTLNNLSDHYDYMKDMEEFRNWLMTFARGHWDKRDVYKHGRHSKEIYNKGNHRDGMNIPGGFSIEFRKVTLSKLMELEKRVLPYRKAYLVFDEELSYIQERWIEEGDDEMAVCKIAAHRNFRVSKSYLEIVDALKVYRKAFFVVPKNRGSFEWFQPYWDSANGINPNANERYFAQLSLQLQKIGKDPYVYARILTRSVDDRVFKEGEDTEEIKDILKSDAINLIKTLPVETRQYYPSKFEEEYVRWEWQQDRVGLMNVLLRYTKGEIEKPRATLFGYEGEYGLHFEQIDEIKEKGDIIDCESIPLKDKMAFFEEWNHL